MKSALKQALADCLARLEAGAGLEECLRGHEALAAELRPLLEAAQALRARDVADYRPDAFQRGRVSSLNADAFITSHSDVTGKQVAFAILRAIGTT